MSQSEKRKYEKRSHGQTEKRTGRRKQNRAKSRTEDRTKSRAEDRAEDRTKSGTEILRRLRRFGSPGMRRRSSLLRRLHAQAGRAGCFEKNLATANASGRKPEPARRMRGFEQSRWQ